MNSIKRDDLDAFIVKAKTNSYVGQGQKSLSYRPGSHDIQFHEGPFSYMDSYFGGTDFLGQEVVYFAGQPIWAMNYYGRILKPELISAEQAGQVIMESLSQLYTEGRFLGGYQHETAWGIYFDTNEGDVFSFRGYEWIEVQSQKAYDLVYHGGLIKE